LLGDTTLNTSKFSAVETVESISDVARDSRVSFVGGKSITLEPGFETTDRALFIATIDPCETPAARALIRTRAQELKENAEQRAKDKIEVLTVRKPTSDLINVSYFIEKPGQAELGIYDMAGNKVYTLMDYNFSNQGLYQKTFRTKKLGEGNYIVKLVRSDEVYTKAVSAVSK